ncbi:MAG: glycine cleavage system protein GcvH [Alphaproteobacteria bacterium]|nr:glycine cleavage system protein GcvH [Alphaproteobacteria bacterium]
MSETRYSEDHEWISLDGDVGTVGVSNYAQEQLGDVVFVDLPAVGARFAKGDEAAVVESVKAASEIYAPAGGEVMAVNEALADDPSKVNEAAEGEGWFFRLRLEDAAELEGLMDASAYAAYVDGLD